MILRYLNFVAWAFATFSTLTLLRRGISLWLYRRNRMRVSLDRVQGHTSFVRWKLQSVVALLSWLWIAAQYWR